jgi:hypothetical protein
MKGVLSVWVASFGGHRNRGSGENWLGQTVGGLDCESVEESGRRFD